MLCAPPPIFITVAEFGALKHYDELEKDVHDTEEQEEFHASTDEQKQQQSAQNALAALLPQASAAPRGRAIDQSKGDDSAEENLQCQVVRSVKSALYL